MSKFFHGTPLLLGDNTVPGVQLSKELKEYIPIILQACRDWGLDFYPTVVQLMTYDEISEIAAYGGFPVRFPHWSFGMEYEELQRGYEYGMHKIFELVVNCCDPSTKVLTYEGSKTAGEVKINDQIMGPNGWRNVVAVKKQSASKVIEITCDELSLKTICTPNHKWKCVRDGEAVWVETSDLKVGDVIQAGGKYENYLYKPAQLNWSPDKIINETRLNVRNRLLPIDPPKEMTLELAELMGALAGDGSVGVRLASQVMTICVHKPQVEYQKHLADLFFKVFKREATIDIKKKSVNVIRLASKFAVDYLNVIGWSYKEIWGFELKNSQTFDRSIINSDSRNLHNKISILNLKLLGFKNKNGS